MRKLSDARGLIWTIETDDVRRLSDRKKDSAREGESRPAKDGSLRRDVRLYRVRGYGLAATAQLQRGAHLSARTIGM